MDLTNAAAIVTGGTGGVGSVTVRRLAQMGATVVIAAVSRAGTGRSLEPVMHFCHHRRDRQIVSVACKRKMAVTRGAQEPNRSTMPCSPPLEHAFTVRFPHDCVARAAFGAVFLR